ncbi:MAG: hypothetical protein CUN55_09210 [Phototrophicales bacterium]|nr:MAG: hypothetical protein CUN55_09210 [Phototrophicales bacterium]
MNAQELVGKQLGPYMLERILGVGGMAAVYEAFQTSVGRKVAVKVLPSSFAQQEQYVERFKREVELTAKLEHPHILPIYDYGTDNDLSFIVMRLMTGGTLSERLRNQDTLTVQDILKVSRQIASALDYAHRENIIHRDLKPSNVLFDKSNNAYLSDFGISKILGGSATGLTATGQLVGTPAYMAPEQWEGEAGQPATDIYALGILVYVMLTGKTPFDAPTPLGLMRKHMYEDPTPITQFRPELPPTIDAVIEIALAKRPERRYATAMDFVKALEQAVRGEDIIDLNKTLTESLEATNVSVSTREKTNVPAATAGLKMEAQTAETPKSSGRSSRGLFRNLLVATLLIAFIGGGIFLFLNRDEPSNEDAISSQVASLIADARSALENDELAVALVRLNDALEQDTENIEAYVLRAETYLRSGNPAKALEDANAALQRNPEMAQAFLIRGQANLALGEYEAAMSDLDQCLALDPALAEAHFAKGETFIATNDLASARASFETVLELQSNNVEAYLKLGEIALQQEDPVFALEAVNNAIRINSNSPRAFVLRGDIHFSQGELEEARLDYRQAMILDDTYAPAYLGLGNVYMALERYDDAQDAYEQYLNLVENREEQQIGQNARSTAVAAEATASVTPTYTPTPTLTFTPTATPTQTPTPSHTPTLTPTLNIPATVEEAIAQFDAGNYEIAVELFSQVLVVEPDNLDALLGRGASYYELRQLEEARRDLERLLELNPTEEVGYYNLGLVEEVQGNYEAALANYDQAIELFSDYADAYLGKTRVLFNTGDYVGCIAAANETLERNYRAPEIVYNFRGLCFSELNNTAVAITDFETAIQLQPEFTGPYFNLGGIYYDLGDYEKSLEYYRQYVDLAGNNADSLATTRIIELENRLTFPTPVANDPARAEAFFAEGNQRYDQGDYEGAVESYLEAIRNDGTKPKYYNNLGNAYFALQDFESAQTAYTQAMQIDPNYVFAYNNRGNLYYQLENYEAAVADYEAAIAIDDEYADAYYGLGLTQYEMEDYLDAIASYSRAIALEIDRPYRVFNARGNAYFYGLDNRVAAENDYLRAIELKSDYAFPYFNLGNLYYVDGDNAQALEYYEQYVALVGEENISDNLATRIAELRRATANSTSSSTNTGSEKPPAVIWQLPYIVDANFVIGIVDMDFGKDGLLYVSGGRNLFAIEPTRGEFISGGRVNLNVEQAFAQFAFGDNAIWTISTRPARTLNKYALDGTLLLTFEDFPLEQRLAGKGPVELSIGPDGRIYVVYETPSDSIMFIFTEDGALSEQWVITQFSDARLRQDTLISDVQIAFLNNGNLIAIDSLGNVVQFAPDGAMVKDDYPDLRPNLIGGTIYDFAISVENELYFSAGDGLVYRFDAELNLLRTYGDDTLIDLSKPQVLELSEDGNLVIADNDPDNGQIVRLRP